MGHCEIELRLGGVALFPQSMETSPATSPFSVVLV
jgi:hypothetical protein